MRKQWMALEETFLVKEMAQSSIIDGTTTETVVYVLVTLIFARWNMFNAVKYSRLGPEVPTGDATLDVQANKSAAFSFDSAFKYDQVIQRKPGHSNPS